MRMAFIEKNAVPLSDKETWSVVQTQFRALRHGNVMQAIMKGHFDSTVRPPSRVRACVCVCGFVRLKLPVQLLACYTPHAQCSRCSFLVDAFV